MSTLTFTPEQLDSMLSDNATRKVLEANPATKDIVLDWEAARAARVAAAIKAAKAQKFTLAGKPVTLAQLATFLQGVLPAFNEKTAGNYPTAVVELANEAREQLGVLFPASSKWKGLEALKS